VSKRWAGVKNSLWQRYNDIVAMLLQLYVLVWAREAVEDWTKWGKQERIPKMVEASLSRKEIDKLAI